MTDPIIPSVTSFDPGDRVAGGRERIGKWELDTVQNVDALTLLAGLPNESVDLVVTSPPYDNLRTYNGYSFEFEPIARIFAGWTMVRVA